MNLEQVYREFRRMSGITAQEFLEWRAICGLFAEQIAKQVSEGADASDPRLALAAAGQAYYQYALTQAGRGGQNVKIGDLSVSQSAKPLEHVKALRDELFAAAAPLLDGGFAILRQV